jgi:hypothetical protein
MSLFTDFIIIFWVFHCLGELPSPTRSRLSSTSDTPNEGDVTQEEDLDFGSPSNENNRKCNLLIWCFLLCKKWGPFYVQYFCLYLLHKHLGLLMLQFSIFCVLLVNDVFLFILQVRIQVYLLLWARGRTATTI